MDNVLYIVWEKKFRLTKVFLVKLVDLTPNECKLWLSIHNKYLENGNSSELEKAVIRKLQYDLEENSKYVKSDESPLKIISNSDNAKGLFIFTGE